VKRKMVIVARSVRLGITRQVFCCVLNRAGWSRSGVGGWWRGGRDRGVRCCKWVDSGWFGRMVCPEFSLVEVAVMGRRRCGAVGGVA